MQGNIDYNLKSEWCYLKFFGMMMTWCLLPPLYFLTRDFIDVATCATFPHGVSLHEVEGTSAGVDLPWFLQLCIHELEQGLMLEAKDNPKNVKFAFGDLQIVSRYHMLMLVPSVKQCFFEVSSHLTPHLLSWKFSAQGE
jgi:hypothetical protein